MFERFSTSARPVLTDSPRKRRLVLFLVDASESTSEKAAGDTVSKDKRFFEGLECAEKVFAADPTFSRIGRIATVYFNSDMCVTPFVDLSHWKASPPSPYGQTYLGEALKVALDLVEQDVQQLAQAGLQIDVPQIVLISDGIPFGESQNVLMASIEQAREAELSGDVDFTTIGVEESDRQHLAQLGFKNPPRIVADTDWKETFTWVSRRVSRGATGQHEVSISLPQ